jgi:hypothetical protein
MSTALPYDAAVCKMAKKARDVGAEILLGHREIKRGESGCVIKCAPKENYRQ